MKQYTAPGIDTITVDYFKEFKVELPSILCEDKFLVWKWNIPWIFEKGQVGANIIKGGDSSLSNYRLILLLSATSNITEASVNKRLFGIWT